MALKVAATEFLPAVLPIHERLLSLFPQRYFKYCFAYGSAVMPQAGVKVGKPMIDMVFAVSDSDAFHADNILQNPDHYSSLKLFGNRFVSFVQSKLPAKVYYNTLVYVKEEDVLLKYGVVSVNDLIDDLLDWDYLYLSGRLHKPVRVLVPAPPENNMLKMGLEENLSSALNAAFLMLPELFTERELYMTIANLSYNGDFRMLFGEDKNKVRNIVEKQIIDFRALYKPHLDKLTDYIDIPEDPMTYKACRQDMSQESRMYHLFQLPKVPMKNLVSYWKFHNGRRSKDMEDCLHDISSCPKIPSMMEHVLSRIVLKSSISQSLKGIFTAGFKKAFQYSNKKINKMVESSKSSQL